jgi:hypothetical protein
MFWLLAKTIIDVSDSIVLANNQNIDVSDSIVLANNQNIDAKLSYRSRLCSDY